MYKIKGMTVYSDEDKYWSGCIPGTGWDYYDKDIHFEGETADEIVKKVADYFQQKVSDLSLDACDEKGRIDVGCLTNENVIQATKHELAQWKKGNIKLYRTVCIFYVEKVSAVSLIKKRK
jgi:hypothetical protein